MALPSSGQLSFSAIRNEFAVIGTCLETGAQYSLSNLRLAQVPSYSYGTIIYVSGFYGSACPKK